MSIDMYKMIASHIQREQDTYGNSIGLHGLRMLANEGNYYNFTPIFEDYSTLVDDLGEDNIEPKTKQKYVGSYLDVNNIEYTEGGITFTIKGNIDLPYDKSVVKIVADDHENPPITLIYGFHQQDEDSGSLYFISEDDRGNHLPFSIIARMIYLTKDGVTTFFIPNEAFLKKHVVEGAKKELATLIRGHVGLILRTFDRLIDDCAERDKLIVYREVPDRGEKTRFITSGYKKTKKKVELPLKTIYIVLDEKKKQVEVKKYAKGNRQIEYACSWIVRGHYRQLHNQESIGINRFTGQRTEVGRTWIEPYQKGDPNLQKKVTLTTVMQATMV